MSTTPILLAAGGTGGHLFPAAALAQELARRGYTVELATDIRAEQYGDDFPARAIHRIPSATHDGRNPVAMAQDLLTARRRLFRCPSPPEENRAERGDRLRRLSDFAADHRRAHVEDPDRDP